MKKGTLCLVVFIIIIFVLFAACQKGNTIKIGYSGTLTGKNSPLGIAVKDGVILAIEEINADGGINGKKLELIIKDDKNDPDTAIKVDAELINEDVCTIIGHITSSMTKAALPQANDKQMLLLSPTTSSLKVLEVDDNLISINPPNIYGQEALGKYIIGHSKNISMIYNAQNYDYSQPWITYFSDYFKGIGGSVDAVYSYSDKNNDLFKATDDLLEKKPQGVLIIASAIDTARICQQIEKAYPKKVLKFSSGWALDNSLIEQGGKSVEGLVLPNSWDKNSTTESYLAFRDAFFERYKREPQFAETFGYETAMILSEILQSGTKPEPMKIKEKILNIGQIKGLQGKIMIDEKGMAKRDVFLFGVEGSEFKRILE